MYYVYYVYFLHILDDEVNLVNVIEVEVSEEIACERVLGRARGSDDNIKVFKNTFNTRGAAKNNYDPCCFWMSIELN